MIVCSEIKKLVRGIGQMKHNEEKNEMIVCSEINNDGFASSFNWDNSDDINGNGDNRKIPAQIQRTLFIERN